MLFLTAVPTVCAGDELLWLLVTVMFLGPQTEATDGYRLCHRLREIKKNRKRESKLDICLKDKLKQHRSEHCVNELCLDNLDELICLYKPYYTLHKL